MTKKVEWVIWNGSLGVLDMVTVGRIEDTHNGRNAFLDSPYGVVGPFSLDELETEGRISFGECLVMSRERWQSDQAGLRAEAMKKRRAQMLRMTFGEDDKVHREALHLPTEGRLEASEINAAFRRLAKKAHPDAGGSSEDYRRISDARDALIEMLSEAML